MRTVFADTETMIRELEPSYPVYCLRPAALEAAARAFVERFPGRVLYAVKCNPHPAVIEALYRGGIRHFDVASLPEVAQLREQLPDAMLYFMHPVKPRAVIRNANRVYEVTHFAVDHPAELAKVIDEVGTDGISILVRMATPQAVTSYDLSAKFGASPAATVDLLRAVRDAGGRPGLTFHVGSQCLEPRAYRTALDLVGRVLDSAETEIHYLDVGGGFPGDYPGMPHPPIEDYFREIEAGLAGLRLRRDCVVMCEPGRALVAGGVTLVVQVLLRKENQIYINDGLYGSLSETLTARLRLPVRLVRLDRPVSGRFADFTVNGPTCDSLDVLPSPFRLPDDVDEGDWIEIGQIGAYSNALATRFNGFHPETYVEIEGPDRTIRGNHREQGE